MIITDLVCQEKNKMRYNVFIDYNYSFSVSYDEAVEFGIKKDRVLTEEDLYDLLCRIQYRKALSRGLSMLSIKSRSSHEIENKLKELDYNAQVIDKVLLRLSELGYINDMEFSKQWIDSKMNIRPVGKKMLASSLKNKGVDPSVIDDVLDDSGYDDLDTAVELVKKKLRQSEKAIKEQNDVGKLYSKLYRYLLYRGINYDTAKKAVNICLMSQIDE